MNELERESSHTLKLNIGETPSSAPSVTITHEYGDTVATDLISASVSGTTYGVSLTSAETESAGVHKAIWSYTAASVEKTKTQYFNIFTRYIDQPTFFDRHPELEDNFSSKFDEYEKKVRDIINTFCGQNFYFQPNKTLTLEGNGNRNLYLTYRLDSLASVSVLEKTSTETLETDITDDVEINPETKFYLRKLASGGYFHEGGQFKIYGDWGWPYIPTNITNAADLLVEDMMNDDSKWRQHGVQSIEMDTHRFRHNPLIFDSTGNVDADVLLMDYTIYMLTLI